MITQAHAAQTASDDSAEMEKVAAFDKNSSIDGRYQFRRKLGCQYRAALPTHNQNLLKDNQKLPPCPSYEELNQFQYMSTKLGKHKLHDSYAIFKVRSVGCWPIFGL